MNEYSLGYVYEGRRKVLLRFSTPREIEYPREQIFFGGPQTEIGLITRASLKDGKGGCIFSMIISSELVESIEGWLIDLRAIDVQWITTIHLFEGSTKMKEMENSKDYSVRVIRGRVELL